MGHLHHSSRYQTTWPAGSNGPTIDGTKLSKKDCDACVGAGGPSHGKTARAIMRRKARFADRDFKAAIRAHERDIAEAEADFDQRLRDREANTALGLPADLPESTIAILKRTQALNLVGPDRPDKQTFLRAHGLLAPTSPDAEAKALLLRAAHRASLEASRKSASG